MLPSLMVTPRGSYLGVLATILSYFFLKRDFQTPCHLAILLTLS
ncbi:rCG48881 [Rattus norvegicus]|uniref:RCG48881 n=1 Tax=Rattus norvegicus TaxID=10116 RepID=A6IG52_RAT|nr:rCG48881 [Rattus norvegicus]